MLLKLCWPLFDPERKQVTSLSLCERGQIGSNRVSSALSRLANRVSPNPLNVKMATVARGTESKAFFSAPRRLGVLYIRSLYINASCGNVASFKFPFFLLLRVEILNEIYSRL